MQKFYFGLVTVLFCVTTHSEQMPVEVFYLAVGIGSYAQAPTDSELQNATSFKSTPGPWSAFRVSQALSVRNARFGIELRGQEGSLVRKRDVSSALDDVIARAKTSRNPLIIYYVNAHGVSEGLGWNLFTVPGDFIGPFPFATLEEASTQLLSAAEVITKLQASGSRFLALFDHCYEGKEEEFKSGAVLTPEAARNLNDILAVLRFPNEFKIEDPVIFSTTPGTTVPAAPDPSESFSETLGPLARRLLLSVKQFGTKGFDLVDLVDLIAPADPTRNFDHLTRPCLTRMLRPGSSIRISALTARVSPERRTGSGALPSLEGFKASKPSSVDDGPEKKPVPGAAESRFEYTSDPGDWIGDGKSATGSGNAIRLVEQNHERLAFEITLGEDRWTVDFQSPAGNSLAAQRYRNAERIPFQNEGAPGFSVTSPGRSCNKLSASFTILDINRDSAGNVSRFSASFEQQCDEASAKIRGTIRFRPE